LGLLPLDAFLYHNMTACVLRQYSSRNSEGLEVVLPNEAVCKIRMRNMAQFTPEELGDKVTMVARIRTNSGSRAQLVRIPIRNHLNDEHTNPMRTRWVHSNFKTNVP
jgi:hypothetical protein